MKKLILLAMVLLMVPSIGLAKEVDIALTLGIGPGQATWEGNPPIVVGPFDYSCRKNYYAVPLAFKDTSPFYAVSGQLIYSGYGLPEIFKILKPTMELNVRWGKFKFESPFARQTMRPYYMSALLGFTKDLWIMDGYLLAGFTHYEAFPKYTEYKPSYIRHKGTPADNLFSYKIGFYKLWGVWKGVKIGPEITAQGFSTSPGASRCIQIKEKVIQYWGGIRIQY